MAASPSIRVSRQPSRCGSSSTADFCGPSRTSWTWKARTNPPRTSGATTTPMPPTRSRAYRGSGCRRAAVIRTRGRRDHVRVHREEQRRRRPHQHRRLRSEVRRLPRTRRRRGTATRPWRSVRHGASSAITRSPPRTATSSTTWRGSRAITKAAPSGTRTHTTSTCSTRASISRRPRPRPPVRPGPSSSTRMPSPTWETLPCSSVRDRRHAGTRGRIATLGAGATAELTAETTLGSSPTTNVATATGEDRLGMSIEDTDAASVTVVAGQAAKALAAGPAAGARSPVRHGRARCVDRDPRRRRGRRFS